MCKTQHACLSLSSRVETKNFFSFILNSEIRGYKRTFPSQFWIFWACFVYFFLISPGNTFEKRQQKQRLAFFSKLCSDQNKTKNTKYIQNIQTITKKMQKVQEKRGTSLSQNIIQTRKNSWSHLRPHLRR